MDFLKDKKFLRELLKQADIMNTVNGGVRQTSYGVKKDGKDIVITVSNPSISPEAFNFTINKNELLINVMHFENSFLNGQPVMYPLFFKAIIIPYYVDINRIQATYANGVFELLLPYNDNLPEAPFNVQVKNRDT